MYCGGVHAYSLSLSLSLSDCDGMIYTVCSKLVYFQTCNFSWYLLHNYELASQHIKSIHYLG